MAGHPPVNFLSARVSNRVEAFAAWEVQASDQEYDLPTLMRLARDALGQQVALGAGQANGAISPNVIPVQVVLGVRDDGTVDVGTVSVPIEERYGRDWVDERQTDTHDRALRLLRDALK